MIRDLARQEKAQRMTDDSSRFMGVQTAFLNNMQREARQRRTLVDAAAHQLAQAEDAVEGLVADIEYFESMLETDQEAQMVVIGGPAGTAIFPQCLCAIGSDRIRYEGVDQDGCRVTVIQHVSQLNIMLKAVKVGEDKARRIGFHIDDEE